MSSSRPGPVCNRCRQTQAAQGDSWCLGCTSWEALGRELSGHWDTGGCRVIASDIVVNCVRQVRALRSLGAGIARAAPITTVTSSPGAGSHRASSRVSDRTADREGPREPLPRSRAAAPPPPVAKAELSGQEGDEDDFDGESEEEEEEERSPTPEHRPIKPGSRQPPEPDGPPPGHPKGRDRRFESEAGANRAPAGHTDRERSRRGEHRRRRGSRRGGRKHQRLYRLAVDPHLRVHRKPPEDYWRLSCIDSNSACLDRAILQQ